MASRTTNPVLDTRALNRATLARQLLLSRAEMSAEDAVTHLVGLQAQNVKPPYYQLHARLAGFRPGELAELMEARRVVRMVTMRSTIHTHTAHDALTLRPLVQAARDREVGYFRKGLVGVDLGRLAARARAFVEAEPRTMGEIREELLEEWPGADPQSLSVAARCLLPLVQVTPRGVWGRSGQVRLTTAARWIGESEGHEREQEGQAIDGLVLRYLGAFGPASVKDMQTWAGLTRLREVFERLRPRLLAFQDGNGTELFDLPDAPRPDADTPAPPRFLPEFDNLLLSHADRSRVLSPESKSRIWTGNQAHCALLVDGFLAGLWKVEANGDGDTDGLVVELFGECAKGVQEEIVAEGEALLAGMGRGAGPVRFGSIHG
ncbi:winged helix DNA-binding domain-containing protein [Streptomyces sp. NBC_00249]|uniref:winged helix DNA-binding domain-containing protein n=1 Tax=Streptomyces sp. NBC_00249 TaxID=2975690 RepID=UPI00225B2646|nr:winged helix DNA-binding domain-containing protein [Streptomyces sp. NBC_00249]MCX5193583.1 winged helix DNA-binding domain-containing protein [Streptomyces sp. NBC_00249]